MTAQREHTSTTKIVEVFADIVCPFTHVGLKRLIAYRDEHSPKDVALRARAWPLELVNGAPLERELLTEEVAELRVSVASDLFTGFDPTLFPMTALPALALAGRAYRAGTRRGELVSLALREALFEQGRDISDPTELAAIGSSFGVDQPDAGDEAAVLADLAEGRARGVIGSPYFFVDDTGFFCPSLAIERVDGQLGVAFDVEGFTAFIGRCFETEGR